MRAVTVYGCCLLYAVGASAADVDAERETIARIAHLEELCVRDPGHSDCTGERRRGACTDARATLAAGDGEAGEAADLATDITVRLVRYVANVMVDAECDPRAADDSGLDTLFREVLLERHKLLVALAGTVKTDLDVRAGNVRSINARLRRGAEWFAGFAAEHDVEMVDIDGKSVDAEPVIKGMCSSLPDTAGWVIDQYTVFDEHFAGVPAARYAHDRLEADTFNALAITWDALLLSEHCAEYAPVADSWRVGLRFVEPGKRLSPLADPTTRLVGVNASGAGVVGRLDELRHVLARAAGSHRERVCGALGARLNDEFVRAWAASRKLSREADYHFVNERAHQLKLLREAHDAATALNEDCGADVDPAPWREDYLRHVVAFVELLEPPLAATLSRYLGSRFDVDMDRDD